MPKIFVSTYAKYNAGTIKGEWVDLDGYSTKYEFYEHIAELHKDEHDPEYMFQDFEDVPSALVSESSIDARLWDWLELDESEREMAEAAWEHVDEDMTIEQILDAYMGEASSPAEWADEFLEETGVLDKVPESLRPHIDFAGYARDARLGGDVVFAEPGGYDPHVYVFSTNY